MRDKVTLLLGGDIFLGGRLGRSIQEGERYEDLFGEVKGYFQEADLVFGNLESPLSESDQRRENRAYILSSPPESVRILEYLGFNVLSLANNHISDYGQEGLIKTLEILRSIGIHPVGAGQNKEEANQAVIIESGSIKIGFLAYANSERHVGSVSATVNTAGCIPLDTQGIVDDVRQARQECDIVCVSLHWGHEFYRYPSPSQIDLAHRAIDAGAHIIIGHHPHVIQGIERYRQGVILYSLGNLFFPDFNETTGELFRWTDESRITMMVRCLLARHAVTNVELIPVYMDPALHMHVLQGCEKETVLDQVRYWSRRVKTGDNYNMFWSVYFARKKLELARRDLSDVLKRARKNGVKRSIRKLLSRATVDLVGRLLR